MQCNVKMFQNSSQKHAAFQLLILMGHFHMYAAYEMKFRIQSSNPDRVSSRSGASERRLGFENNEELCFSFLSSLTPSQSPSCIKNIQNNVIWDFACFRFQLKPRAKANRK